MLRKLLLPLVISFTTLTTQAASPVAREERGNLVLENVPALDSALTARIGDYTFARSAWGQGLATEVAQALVEIWQRRCSEPSLVGIVMKGNLSSERALLKTGFSYERDAVFHDAQCGVFRRVR